MCLYISIFDDLAWWFLLSKNWVQTPFNPPPPSRASCSYIDLQIQILQFLTLFLSVLLYFVELQSEYFKFIHEISISIKSRNYQIFLEKSILNYLILHWLTKIDLQIQILQFLNFSLSVLLYFFELRCTLSNASQIKIRC